MLPGIDDGSKNLDMSLDMARMASSDGITIAACTPHILPTVYDNNGSDINAAVDLLQKELVRASIPLRLVSGADVHVSPTLPEGLKSGRILTLNGSRYLLLEPPHHVAPPQLEEHVFRLHALGYIAILTHPERLSWIESQYSLIKRMVHNGVWVQLTAGSLIGRFGRRPKYWAERMLDEGCCHILATDAHNTTSRAPRLAEARDVAAKRLGEQEAMKLVLTRPRGVIDDVDPAQLSDPVKTDRSTSQSSSLWKRVLTSIRGGKDGV
jgi:Capsular polysaccharide biosynthesis protein